MVNSNSPHGAEVPVVTPQMVQNYVIRPAPASDNEQRMVQAQEIDSWSHVKPNSVLVCGMGNHWKPGCWQHANDMVKHTIDTTGIWAEFIEVQDRCFNYADGLGTMRNEAVNLAKLRGVEFLVFLENDVQPREDALIRMINAYGETKAGIIAPYVVETGTGRPLHGPHREPDSGRHFMKWAVLSMIMFKVSIFNHYDAFWQDAIGADEGYHFEKFRIDNHWLLIDTGIQVPAHRRPQYPLATNHLQHTISKPEFDAVYGPFASMFPHAQVADFQKFIAGLVSSGILKSDREKHWEKRNAERRMAPDRRPIDPGDKRIDANGNYNPWMEVPKEEPAFEQPAAPAPTVEPSKPLAARRKLAKAKKGAKA